jgi:mono/diheme cytochrome c family protein
MRLAINTFIVAAAFLFQSSLLAAPKTVGAHGITYEGKVKPLLEQYCYGCHGNGKHKGDLALDDYKDLAAVLKDRKRWALVMKNLENHEMPPENKPQPAPAERDLIQHWIENELFNVAGGTPDPGRVTIRRLNRAEYNNTIRDLVGVDFHPADDFPADDVGYGFDNIGDVLSLPPLLLEKYLTAADKIMDEAIVTHTQYIGPTARFEAEKLPHLAKDSSVYGGYALSLNKEGDVFLPLEVSQTADYLIRVRAFGQQAGPELTKLELRLNEKPLKVFEVAAVETASKTYEFKVRLEEGPNCIAAAYINNFVDPNLGDRNLVIDYLEIVGPVQLKAIPDSQRRIFGQQPKTGAKSDWARQIVSTFVKRAYRHPAEKQEVDRLMQLFEATQKDGSNFEEGIQITLQAVLVSPNFLFRGELQPEPDNPKSVQPVNDYALASRLSYFLWSSMPDDELFALAEKKSLRKNLDAQIKRMLQSPRANALVENFADQWLQIRNLANVSPDPKMFPRFNEGIRKAMQQETESFFQGIVREDRSVLEFIDADYTYLNEPLAQFYGIPDVKGPAFRRVPLGKSRRGGVLTQASVLTITSNPTRTSPVKRGKWILENILGTPPPPPPPDVPELSEAKEKVLSGTLRQRMEQHREKPICASCHARMDPIGFGFENFDAIGQWRDKDGTFDIDPAGKLVSGETFIGPSDLKTVLRTSKRDEYLRCLTEKMLTFALGRGIEYYDKPAVDRITTALVKNKFKFSTLISEVAHSTPFQMRRGEGEHLAENH